jgi:hypothetical protein
MCVSVEMLLRLLAERFFSERSHRESAVKMPTGRCAESFHLGKLLISIGGTLQTSAAPVPFNSLWFSN